MDPILLLMAPTGGSNKSIGLGRQVHVTQIFIPQTYIPEAVDGNSVQLTCRLEELCDLSGPLPSFRDDKMKNPVATALAFLICSVLCVKSGQSFKSTSLWVIRDGSICICWYFNSASHRRLSRRQSRYRSRTPSQRRTWSTRWRSKSHQHSL
jgi:hypothetical protein